MSYVCDTCEYLFPDCQEKNVCSSINKTKYFWKGDFCECGRPEIFGFCECGLIICCARNCSNPTRNEQYCDEHVNKL